MRKIKDYPNYSCDAEGNVYSKWKKLKPTKRNGYTCVTISNKSGHTTRNVHRFIAETLIPNPENKAEVNHIDGVRDNNRVNNLEWVTRQENVNHAMRTGLYKPTPKNRPTMSHPVSQYDMDGNFIKNYLSKNEAARQTGVEPKWIGACVNGGNYRMSGGKKKWINCTSAGDYIWILTELER